MTPILLDPRQNILHTALTLFSSKGYFQTSMQDIKKDSGVSIGAIYHYFTNKEDIALALYQSLLEQMTMAVEELLAQHPKFHDACYAILEHLFNVTKENPKSMQFLLYARHREFLPQLPPICSSRPFELMVEATKQAMEQREIRPLVPVIAVTTIFGGPMRLILLATEGLLQQDLNSLLDPSWDCIWKAIKAD